MQPRRPPTANQVATAVKASIELPQNGILNWFFFLLTLFFDIRVYFFCHSRSLALLLFLTMMPIVRYSVPADFLNQRLISANIPHLIKIRILLSTDVFFKMKCCSRICVVMPVIWKSVEAFPVIKDFFSRDTQILQAAAQNCGDSCVAIHQIIEFRAKE